MRVKSLLTESYECVKIGGILRNLSNDEMKIYKKVKSEGRVYKMDLPEYDANVATTMVSKGLLRRKKAQQDEGHGRIYYTTIGRKGHIKSKEIDEVAPPGKESEKWIKKNKKRFKDKYGKDYEKYLYGKAWNNYNGKKKVNETYDPNQDIRLEDLQRIEKFLSAYINLKAELNNTEDNFPDNRIVTNLYVKASDMNDAVPDQILLGTSNKLTEGLSDSYQSMAQTVAENCSDDYSVYRRGEYDSEQTRDRILSEYDIFNIMRDHMPDRDVRRAAKELYISIKDAIDNYDEEETEPEFSGDFDEVQVAKPKDDSDDEDKKTRSYTFKKVNEILEKLGQGLDDDGSNIIEVVREVYNMFNECYGDNDFNSSVGDDIDGYFTSFRDVGYNYVDEQLYDEDLDFIVRGEEEYDSDATWDAIYAESYATLYEGYGTRSDAEELLNNLEEPFDILYSYYGKRNNISKNIPQISDPESDDAGTEFNE